jgi:hypothetical protein
VADRRAYTRKLAGRDCHAGPAAANDDAAIDLPVSDGHGDGLCNIGVVDRRSGMGPQIQNLVTLLSQDPRKIPLHFVPGVVGADRYSHE